MSNEINREIEEMARDLQETYYEDCEAWHCGGCRYEKYEKGYFCSSIKQAEKIIAKGYRKQSVIEILENKLFKEIFEDVLFSLVYLGADGKWHTKRNNAEKTTAIIERYLKLVAIEEGGE